MPLDTQALEDGIYNLQTDMETRDNDSKREFAQRLTSLIDAFVKSGEVQAGISVQAGPYTGVTTGTGNIL